jgi:atypical dual specificity phosphatase
MPNLQVILRGLGLVIDKGDWIEDGQVLACAYPRRQAALAALNQHGVSMLINLHERGHDSVRLQRFGMTEVHLPVKDFTAPSPEQLQQGVAAIEQAISEGKGVAVHCGGGLGRTGTLLACYLVNRGMTTVDAVRRVRLVRPGSIETQEQVNAVMAYGQSRVYRADATG